MLVSGLCFWKAGTSVYRALREQFRPRLLHRRDRGNPRKAARDDLERRIRERGQDSEDEIRRRLDRARHEMLSYSSYDFAVVNDDLERAGREVQAIALVSRCRVARTEGRILEILKSFGG